MDNPETLRIVIADDVDLVAEAFEALLSTEPGFEVVARASSGPEAVRAVEEYQPQVAILDVDMPGMTGIEAAAGIKQAVPTCSVLLLTALEGVGHLHKALSAGASGYVLKSTTGARLIEAIRTVATGGTAIDPELAATALRTGPCPLTRREVDILRHVGRGASTEQIARSLFLSTGTVRNYLSSAMVKLDADTRAKAHTIAEQSGWL
ncbi:MAG: response regulator transcription factor [Luteococcus sp.]|uniref:response regulator transcription factor n=1 Tax=Luteococcus sp. TaxID=1969402 RepID=UPI0026485A5C|nr:response regulator transcription factor [Luteococcus sp.]MDN5562250.1 response regulator transcription factor [Luteococcus sp.]